MTDSKREASEFIKLFRMLATEKKLDHLDLQIRRDHSPIGEKEHTWKLMLYVGSDDNAVETVSYLNDLAKANGLRVELDGSFVKLRPGGLGAE